MTKFRVLFLIGVMTVISGCCSSDDPTCHNGFLAGIGDRCMENVKRSAVPCVNNYDITMRLKQIHKEIETRSCLRCPDYQRLYCREMLDGIKK